MKTKSPFNFYITYFANKHGTRITRKAQEPNPVGTAGRRFVDRHGVDRYISWDLEKGNWRHATGYMDIKEI